MEFSSASCSSGGKLFSQLATELCGGGDHLVLVVVGVDTGEPQAHLDGLAQGLLGFEVAGDQIEVVVAHPAVELASDAVEALAKGIEGGEVKVEGGNDALADGLAGDAASGGLLGALDLALDLLVIAEVPEQLGDGDMGDLEAMDLVEPVGGLAGGPAPPRLLPHGVPEGFGDLGGAGHRGLLEGLGKGC